MKESPRIRPSRGFAVLAALLLTIPFAWLAAQPPLPDSIFRNGFEPPNQPPVADAGMNQSATVGVPLVLDGSASFDPDGGPLGYAWWVVARPADSGAEVFDGDQVGPVLIPDQAGTYVVQLIVSDGELFSEPATVTITASGTLTGSALIGPTGGAVGLPDGASVLIPPGALDTLVPIAIAEVGLPAGSVLPATAELAGGVYELTPHGQLFQRPARFVIPYDPDLLPPGYDEGAIRIYRKDNAWAEFHMLGSETGDEEPQTDSGQMLDVDNRLITALSSTFSFQTPAGTNIGTQVTQVTRTSDNASVEVLQLPVLRTTRPQAHRCRNNNNTQLPLGTRTASQIEGIVVHSTNGGNRDGVFGGPITWAIDRCTQAFTHYYIDRNGEIVQIVDDLNESIHVGSGGFGLEDSNTIGIELYLNVGEPYDGRQIAALIRLVDYLMDEYALPRSQRDPVTGLVSRNRVHINQGGDRIVAHVDLNPDKCDPSGVFMDYGIIKPEFGQVNCKDPNEPRVAPQVLSVGSSLAPAPIDVLLDVVAVLDRGGQHTGIINTQGGDAFELGQAGHGGNVSFTEEAAAVDAIVGTAERKDWEENEPTLAGPGPLIVAPGNTVTLTASRVALGGDIRHYTDVIIAGTLHVDGNLGFALTGTFYLAPNGRIIIRDGRNGGSLGVFSRGVPIVQGLIDARGANGVDGTPDGGNGGWVSFTFSHPGVLLLPTLYTRGGDADFANALAFGGGPRGGDGGDITLTVAGTHVFLGGGIGPYVAASQTQLPPFWFAGTIEASLFNPNVGARWAGDYLPPTPPVRRYSAGTSWPPPLAYRVPKRTIAVQPGFKRGILSSGGMGGAGVATADGNQHGGPAGEGGNVTLQLGGSGTLSFRDADIATGGEIESMSHRLFMPPPAIDGLNFLTCTSGGAHGGFGQDVSGIPAGNGGTGGAAGAVAISGGTLQPQPASFDGLLAVQGFPPTQIVGEPMCQRGTEVVGTVLEAKDSEGHPLYRLRLDLSGKQLLGGHGGIPSGRRVGNPGSFGPRGATAPMSGLPTQ